MFHCGSFAITIDEVFQTEYQIRIQLNGEDTSLSRTEHLGYPGKSIYVPTNNCIKVGFGNCVSLGIYTQRYEVKGYVEIFWDSKRIFNHTEVFRMATPTKTYHLSDGKVLDECDGKSCLRFGFH